MTRLMNVLLPVATLLNKQKHIAALRMGMMITLPLTIVGAIFLVLAQPPVNETMIEGTNFFVDFLLIWKGWALSYQTVLLIPYQLTIGILSIYTVFAIAYFLAQSYKLNPINNGFQGLLIFLIIAVVPANIKGTAMLPTTFLDAKGMFTAVFIGLLTVEITHFLDQRGLKIKMPESVPPMVAAPFEIMIPLFTNIVLFSGINQVVIGLTGSGLVSLVQTLLRPLLSVSGTLSSILLINVLATTFWFFGIHGTSILNTVVIPIATLNFTENAAAYQTGETIPNVFAGFYNNFYGSWITYPALLCCFLLFVKSTQLKSLARTALIPHLFNINEPLIFGLPIVMNVILIIPIYLSNTVNIAVSYWLMNSGIVGKFIVNVPWTTPGPVAVFLSTLDWKATILWFALFGVDVLICLPFVKSYDQQVRLQNAEVVK